MILLIEWVANICPQIQFEIIFGSKKEKETAHSGKSFSIVVSASDGTIKRNRVFFGNRNQESLFVISDS